MPLTEPTCTELCAEYADLALTIALSIWSATPSLQSRLPRSEVESAANYALYQAASSWNPSASTFRSWLNRKIRYELLETARREVPVRRAGIARARVLTEAEKVVGEDAPDHELASAAGCEVVDIQEARRLREQAKEPMSVDSSGVDAALAALDEEVTTRLVVLDAIAELDPQGQAVMMLHYFDGIPFSKIADSLGIRKDQVSRIHSRAKVQLRTQLQAA